MALLKPQTMKSSFELRLLIPNISAEDGGRYVCSGQAGDHISDKIAHITVQTEGTLYKVIFI